MAENNQRGQETAREDAPIHCIHPCVMKGCFGAISGALGSTPAPPKGIRPNNSHPKGGHKKKRPKNPSQGAASTASKSLRTILGEVGIFRQEGVRLLDALLDCRWESHDDWCRRSNLVGAVGIVYVIIASATAAVHAVRGVRALS